MASTDIVALLSRWLRFADASSRADNLAAFCPFHKGGKEQSPGLYVYVGRPRTDVQPGTAWCHTCHRAWTFPNLLLSLGANHAVVESVLEQIRADEKYAVKSKQFTGINFDNPVLPETVLAVFDYCPVMLRDQGFDLQVLRENDVGFDRDRQRVTFGIRDHLGNLVGVSGRTVIGEEPRYKIYRSEFYGVCPGYNLEKSKVLWGLDKFYHTRLHFADDDPVVVCEGFKQALWTKMAGIDNTVALLGSAISVEQRILLSRITNEVVLFLDHNTAGRKATWQYSRLLKGVDVRIVDYASPYDMQPDALPLDRVRTLIETAPTAREWRKTNGGD